MTPSHSGSRSRQWALRGPGDLGVGRASSPLPYCEILYLSAIAAKMHRQRSTRVGPDKAGLAAGSRVGRQSRGGRDTVAVAAYSTLTAERSLPSRGAFRARVALCLLG